MADISKQQLRDIILKAPQGTTPQGILDALQSQGHTVEGLAQRQSTPAPQQQEKPGVVSRTASYLGKELLTGGAQRTGEEGFALGFGKDIAETTFGSRGLAGVAQLPGLVAGQLPALQSRRATAENAGQLANATTELIKRRREETNPIRKQRLTEMINSNLAQLQESNQAGQELDRFVRTPGQALGTTGNAALTLATLGTGNIATRGALSAAESLAPKALPTVQKVVTAGKSVVPRAVETGAAAAGFRAGENLSEGKPLTEDVFEAALIGAAFPVAAAGIKATFKPLKDKASQKFIDTLIKPRAVDRAYGKNPGKQIAQESIVAWTYDDLVKKIGLKKQEAGKAIEQNAQRFANEIVDVHDFLQPLDDAIATAQKFPETNKTLIGRLQGLRDDITDYTTKRVTPSGPRGQFTIDDLVDTFQLPVPEAIKLKREIGELAKWTGNPSDDELVNKAMQKMYVSLRDGINHAAPGMQKLNDRYGNLLQAEKAASYRQTIAERGAIISLTDLTAAGLGGLLGTLSGGPGVSAGAVSVYAIKKALSTPSGVTIINRILNPMTAKQKENFMRLVPAQLRSTIEKITQKTAGPVTGAAGASLSEDK